MDKSLSRAGIEGASWQDYYKLTKPKVVALMLLTAVVGMILAIKGSFPL